MNKLKRISALALALLAFGGCASSARNAPQKGADEKITIVSTSVAICEILDELGFDNVIGVPESSTALPERYKNVKTVGSPMNPDLEIIKSLAPRLVLSPQTLESALAEGYRTAGITSAFLDLSSVEGMYSAIISLGEYLGCEEEANGLKDEYNAYMQSYKSSVTEEQDILLLMAFPDGFYLVATENSYVGNLIKLAGGKNVYDSDYKGDENGFVNINPEDIVQKEPDRIFVFAHYAEEDAFNYMRDEFENNASWQHFDAVRKGSITYLPSEYFGMSATLSWTEALEYLKPVMRGDAE